MKLLTINTHSLVEKDYERKLYDFVEAVICEKPDIIAMQEVNQSRNAAIIDGDKLVGMFSCQSDISLREDNHAVKVAQLLNEKGMKYYWTWLPIKIGYEKYDEGLAIFSRYPIIETDSFLMSNCNDYSNWRTRKVLGVMTDNKNNEWFYSVHMGWWSDEEEPFYAQWKKLDEHIKNRGLVWLMGDFNSDCDIRNEGYDCVKASGWIDTYNKAKDKDNGVTVGENIDGWKDKLNNINKQMRIDYIWTNQDVSVKSSKVIFNGINKNIVSDHYGIIITVDS